MNSLNAASLINLLGFTVGIALYALLFVMVLRRRQSAKLEKFNYLLLATSILGLIWNVGELGIFVWRDFTVNEISPLLTAFSYSALGFLPSAVVHSAQNEDRKISGLTVAAYCLSIFAAILHFQSAIFERAAPSNFALQTLTFGSLALIAGLLVFNIRQTVEKKTIWASALLVFAVSALHLSGEAEEKSWLVELVAHQSSLSIALAILYQNYRFAFADLFLKRAVSLILVAFLAFGLYISVAAPLLRLHETHDRSDVQAITILLTLWIATALIYPLLHNFAVWFVDKIILHRADYAELQTELAREIENNDSIDGVLETIRRRLAETLTAQNAAYCEIQSSGEEFGLNAVNYTPNSAAIYIPTAETPFYQINLNGFDGGRRLLSDEITMLENISRLAARRIDVLRVSHERYAQKFREQEFTKLAAEAQLSVLRAQINPHFLFNALTTIGYLIQTAPEKAFETLLRLTQLLRGVLGATAEFSSFGDELKLIESYLDIEKARFEERLTVKIEVADELKNLRVPPLIVQPLVENSIKHAVSENKNGGEVRISAKLAETDGEKFLHITIFDSGAGAKNVKPEKTGGFGLQNIRRRLSSYYGEKADLILESGENGTEAKIILPIEKVQSSRFKVQSKEI